MKILVIGRPKSGTSMLAGKIKTGMDSHFNINSQLLFEPKNPDWLEKIQENNITKILYSSSSRHISNVNEAEIIGSEFDKKVVICRDPRDVIISSALYRWFYGHKPKKEYFEAAFNLVKRKEENPSSVNLYEIASIHCREGAVTSLEEYKSKLKLEFDRFSEDALSLQKNQWILVKYESLIDGEFESLTRYLGFEISKDIDSNKKAFIRTARSKAYGNWKNWFTEDDVEFFIPVFKKSLKKLGYNENDWTINSKQQIDSSIASEYMTKLFKGF